MNISAIGNPQAIPQNINTQRPSFKAKIRVSSMPEMNFHRLDGKNESTYAMYKLSKAIEKLKSLPDDLVIDAEKYRNCDIYKFTNTKNGLTREGNNEVHTTNPFIDTFIDTMLSPKELDEISSNEVFLNLDTEGGKLKSCTDIIDKYKNDIFLIG